MATNTGNTGTTIVGQGGRPTRQGVVRITNDVKPVWETELLPDWVVYTLLPMLSAGQKWPENVSERTLSELAQAWEAMSTELTPFAEPAGKAVRTVVTNWQAPATIDFVNRVRALYGQQGGVAGISRGANSYAAQVSDYAVETQYSKISINVAFWITVVAISITLYVAFFTAGATTPLIGPYAVAARTAIGRILARLAAAAGRGAGTAEVTHIASLSGANGRGAITRLLMSPLGKELVEEIGEEFFIDAATQLQQIQMGTREDWDWKKSGAAVVGAGSGAAFGMAAAGPISRITGNVPGFGGRMLTSGLSNVVASPMGSFVANGVVYDQWGNPFTLDSMTGAFAGALGRPAIGKVDSISPFNPDVFTALAHPTTFLAAHEGAGTGGTADGSAGGGPGPAVVVAQNGTGSGGGPVVMSTGLPGGGAGSAEGGAQGATPASGGATPPRGVQTDPGMTGGPRRPGTAQGTQGTQVTPAAAPEGPTTEEPPQSGITPPPTAPNLQTGGTPAPSGPQNGTPSGTPPLAAPGANVQTGGTPAPPGTPDGAASGTTTPAASGTPAAADGHNAPGAQAAQAAQAAAGTAAPDGTNASLQAAPDVNGQSGTGPQVAPVSAATAAPDGTNTSAQAAAATGGQSPASAPGGRATVSPATMRLAEAAMTESLESLALETTLMRGGQMRLTGTDGSTVHVPVSALRSVRRRLAVRARDGVGPHRLRAEAAAWLGVEIARTEGRRPLEGALQALHVLAETSPESADAALLVAMEIVQDVPAEVDHSQLTEGASLLVAAANEANEANRPASAPVDEHEALRPERQAETAGRIARQATELATRLAETAANPAGPGSTPSPVSAVLTELTAQAQELARSMAAAEAGLQERRGAKWDSAKAAEKRADKAVRDVEEAEEAARQGRKKPGHRDRRAPERHRQAREGALFDRETVARELRISTRYEAAAERAEAVREAVERTADALGRLAAEQRPGPAASLAAEAAELARQANSLLTEYQEALQEALPSQAAQAAALAAGLLPHLTGLAELVNSIPGDPGFTPASLDNKLKAQLHQLLSSDGAVLRVDGGEVRIKMTMENLVEVLGEEVKASELMLGRMRQGNQAVSVSLGRSTGTGTGVDVPGLLGNLLKVLPVDPGTRMSIEAVLAHLSLGGGHGLGSGTSTGGKAASYVTGGGVTDNRGESSMFSADARYEVEFRPRGETGWRTVGEVADGTPGDKTHAEMYISHAHVEHGPENTVQLRFDEGRTPPVPELAVITMTGLEEANDLLLAELGPTLAGVGSMAQHELRTAVVEELPNDLPRLLNNPDGVRRTLTQGGKPLAEVHITAELRWRPVGNGQLQLDAKAMGTASTKQLGEKLGVSFSEVAGGQGNSRSWNVNAAAGAKFGDKAFGLPDLGAVDLSDVKGLSAKAGLNGSHGRSGSGGVNIGGTSIMVNVARESGHNQAYTFDVETTFTVHVLSEDGPRDPIASTLGVTAQMSESDAYNAGFPADELIAQDEFGQERRHADGSPALRDDALPEAPPGRKGEPPSWQGEGQGKVRTTGMGDVELLTGIAEIRQEAETALRGMGLLPETVNGEPVFSSDPLLRASQVANMEELEKQLSDLRLATDYNELVRQGVLIRVTNTRSGHRPERTLLRVRSKRDWGSRTYVSHTPGKKKVKLYIASDTGSSSRGQGSGWSGGLAVGAGYGSGDGERSASGGAGYGRNRGRNFGENEGLTTNSVLLVEGLTTTASSVERNEVTIEHLTEDGAVLIASGEVWVEHRMAAGMHDAVGSTGPSAEFRTPGRLLDRARPWAIDPGVQTDLLDELAKKMGIPLGGDVYYDLAQFLGDASLLSHTTLLQTPYEIEFIMESEGARPRRWSVSVSGHVGESRHVTTGELVDGDINLTLGSHGSSSGKGSGGAVNASVSGSGSQKVEPTGGAGVDGSRSNSRSASESDLGISGLEGLGIDTGDQALFSANLTTVVTVSEVGTDKTETVTATDGTYMYLKPERDVLDLYARGEVPLPLSEVADAVERFLHGHLELRRATQGALVARYLQDVRAARLAGADLGLAAWHTPQVLLGRLMELFGGHDPAIQLTDPGRRLALLLEQEAERAAHPEPAELASSVRNQLGQSWPEEIVLRHGEDGPQTDLYHAILQAVEAYAPGTLAAQPAWRRGLFSGFAGRNWLGGKLSGMLGKLGYVHSPISGAVQQGAIPPIRLQMDFGDGPVELLAHYTDRGLIVQRYLYSQHSASESSGTSYGGNVGLSGSAGNADVSLGMSGSGGVSYSQSDSASRTEQWTELQRIFTFGLDEVRHELKVTVTVGAENDSRAPVVVELKGHMTRLVPSDLVLTEQPQRVPDPRPMVKLPDTFMVDGMQTDELPAAVRTLLADKRLLGENAEEVKETVERVLSEMRQAPTFRQMLEKEGAMTIRFTDPSRPGKVVELTLRARPQDLHVTVTGRKDTEIGQVLRVQQTVERTSTWSRKFSFGRSTRFLGLSRSQSAGREISITASISSGNRTELSRFQKGTAASVEVPVIFDITAEVKTEGSRKADLRIEVPDASTGKADLTMFERDLEKIEAGRSAEGRRRHGWENLGEPEVTRTTGTDRPGWRAKWRGRPRAVPSPSLDLDALIAEARTVAGTEGNAGSAVAPDVLHEGVVETARWSLLGRWTAGTPILLTATATAPGQMSSVTQARLLARELRTEVRLELREPDGATHHYRATRDGVLHSGMSDGDALPDGGFASAFAVLPAELVTRADQAGVDLRALYNSSPGENDFTKLVRDALAARTTPATTSATTPATAPAAVPAATPDTSSTAPAATPQSSSGTETQQSPSAPEPPQQPNTTRPSGGTYQPSGTGSAPTRAPSAPRQGVIRRFLLAPLMGARSSYVSARYSEHRLLSERWQQTRAAYESHPSEVQEQRLGELERQLNKVAADLRQRGQAPPVPPWEVEPAAPEPGGRLASLLNRPSGEPLPPSHWETQFWRRMAGISNTTGWIPPEEEEKECVCPPDGPCFCGRRPVPNPGDTSQTPGSGSSPAPSPSPGGASPSPSAQPSPQGGASSSPSAQPSPQGGASAAQPSSPAQPQGSPSPGGRTVTTDNSTLWGISEQAYGDGRYWKDIWERNRDVIGPDPDSLPADLELVVPERPQSP
ncbi:hypothetical protein AB0395_17280 [Streptosporangium sp. NPDC051023]|uniref:WXG100-like domain-containing protein n=1 Tax=Streptosporangium sp. NPDC051023 TaxID=3155410 RepID=UPI0034507665